jgi:hypothetical protein
MKNYKALVTHSPASAEPPTPRIMLLRDTGNDAVNAAPLVLEVASPLMGKANNTKGRVPRALPVGIYMPLSRADLNQHVLALKIPRYRPCTSHRLRHLTRLRISCLIGACREKRKPDHRLPECDDFLIVPVEM